MTTTTDRKIPVLFLEESEAVAVPVTVLEHPSFFRVACELPRWLAHSVANWCRPEEAEPKR